MNVKLCILKLFEKGLKHNVWLKTAINKKVNRKKNLSANNLKDCNNNIKKTHMDLLVITIFHKKSWKSISKVINWWPQKSRGTSDKNSICSWV